MESYRRGSGHDIALLTVPTLDGEPIERFALRVAREWKLGSAEGRDKNDGALLVVAKDDRAAAHRGRPRARGHAARHRSAAASSAT